MTTLEIILTVIAGLVALAGVTGTIVPLLPGLPLVWGAIAVYAVLTQFAYISLKTVIVLGVLVLASWLVEVLVIGDSLYRFGGTRYGMIGGLLGFLIGVLGGLPGMLAGLIIGTVAGELIGGTPLNRVAGAGMGALIGLLLSSGVRLVIAIAMLVVAAVDFFR